MSNSDIITLVCIICGVVAMFIRLESENKTNKRDISKLETDIEDLEKEIKKVEDKQREDLTKGLEKIYDQLNNLSNSVTKSLERIEHLNAKVIALSQGDYKKLLDFIADVKQD